MTSAVPDTPSIVAVMTADPPAKALTIPAWLTVTTPSRPSAGNGYSGGSLEAAVRPQPTTSRQGATIASSTKIVTAAVVPMSQPASRLARIRVQPEADGTGEAYTLTY